ERAVGAPVDRLEGEAKVRGQARYAFEYERDDLCYAAIVQATIAKGAVRAVDTTAASAEPGVLAVLSHENAPHLDAEGELAVLQSPRVAYRGQVVAAVVADSLETARYAARLVRIDYEIAEHDVLLRPDH